jgi:hypothetical protein
VSGKATALAIEICSGPLDGTGLQVSGGRFTVGHDPSADVSLPETPGTPSKAAVRYSVDDDGEVSLKAECDLEYGGSQTRKVKGGAGTLFVRVGVTDLALAAATTT